MLKGAGVAPDPHRIAGRGSTAAFGRFPRDQIQLRHVRFLQRYDKSISEERYVDRIMCISRMTICIADEKTRDKERFGPRGWRPD